MAVVNTNGFAKKICTNMTRLIFLAFAYGLALGQRTRGDDWEEMRWWCYLVDRCTRPPGRQTYPSHTVGYCGDVCLGSSPRNGVYNSSTRVTTHLPKFTRLSLLLVS